MATSNEKPYKWQSKLDAIDLLERIRETANQIQVESMTMENMLKEMKKGASASNTDSRDKANTEESLSDMALRIMQSSMDRKRQLNAEELDKDSLCNSQILNLDVDGPSYSEKTVSQDCEEDDEEDEDDEEEDDEEDEDDDEEDDEEEDDTEVDPHEDNFLHDMNMFINGYT